MNERDFERREKARLDAMYDAQFADEPTFDVDYADKPIIAKPMKPTQEQVIAWAREAGVGKAFVCAKPDECPDDDGCCHQNKQDG